MTRFISLALDFLIVVVLAQVALGQAADEKAAGTAAYAAGNYKQSVELLEKATSKNKQDAGAWTMLGTAYFKLGKTKDAAKALEKAIKLDSKNELANANLAMVYSARRDKKAETAAENVLAINRNSPAGHYVLGVVRYQEANYRAAFERGTLATLSDPTFAAAWFLISRSLVATFVDIRDKAVSGATRAEVLRKALEALKTYAELTDPSKTTIQDELKDLQLFADHYSRPENNLQLGEQPPEDDPSVIKTPFKILTKPRPGYTDSARVNNVQGTILLLVGFGATGRVGPIVVLKSLDPGLDRQAIRAAKAIAFDPPTRNGVPYSVVKQLEYTFLIY